MSRKPRNARQVRADLKAEELEIWERLCLAYRAESISVLAGKMKLPLATVKNWRNRGSVPLNCIVRARNETGRSVDWIVLGTEIPSLAVARREIDFTAASAVACPEAPYHCSGESTRLPMAFGEVMVVVLESLRSSGKAPTPEKVARLVELVFEHESLRAKLGPATSDTVRRTADRCLCLLD